MQRLVLRKLRIAVAVALFVGLALALAGLQAPVPVAARHYLASTQFVASLLALATGASASVACIVIVIAALAAGRVYCAAICPFGILQDIVGWILAFVRRRRAFLPYARPFTWMRQAFLWGAVAAIVAGWGGFAIALFDPYGNFGRIVSLLVRPLCRPVERVLAGLVQIAGLSWSIPPAIPWEGVGVIAVPAAVLSLVVVFVAFRGRLYCNTVCPVGTLLGLFSRWAAFRITIDQGSCRKCGECLRACKAQCIDLRHGIVDFSRCIACYDCLGACDNHSVGYRFAWRRNAGARKAPIDPPGNAGGKSQARTVADPQRRTFIATAAVAVAAAIGGAKLRSAEETNALRPGNQSNGRPTRPVCPPGSVGTDQFLSRCVACQLCVGACPTNVLQPSFGEYGLGGLWKPRLDYAAGYCDFDCRRCGEVCPSGAVGLLDLAEKQVTRIGVVHFEAAACVVQATGTACTACSEKCPTQAVRTAPFAGGLRLPRIQPLLCIGCGTCEHVCPARPRKAITVIGRSRHNRARKATGRRAKPPAGVLAGTVSSAICSTTQRREPAIEPVN